MAHQGDEAAQQPRAQAPAPSGPGPAAAEIREDAVAAAFASAMASIQAPVSVNFLCLMKFCLHVVVGLFVT